MDMKALRESINIQTGSGTIVYKTKGRKEPYVVFNVENGRKSKLKGFRELLAAYSFAEGFDEGRVKIDATSVVLKACNKCWGKGYSTQMVGNTGGSDEWNGEEIILRKGGTRVRLCDCDRGKDIAFFFEPKEQHKP